MELWHVLVVLRVIIAYGVFEYLLKKNVGSPSREKIFLLQFLFCALTANIIAFFLGQIALDWTTASIFLLGFFTAFGTYWSWRAIDISQSKNSILTIFDDIIAMTLSYFIFSEGQYLNAMGMLGIILSLTAAIAFGLNDYRKEAHPEKSKPIFYVYVGIYSIIWGVSVFLQKYFGLEGVPTGTFIASWYSGALLAAMVLLIIHCKSKKISLLAELRACAKPGNITSGSLLGVCIIVSLVLAYWTYRIVPQNIAQPIFLVSEMIIPCLIGMHIFKEAKSFDLADKLLLLLGFAGGILVAISF